MDNIGIYEARVRWSELIKRVSGGEEIVITRHGLPVARLVPANGGSRSSAREAIEAIKRLRRGKSLKGLRVKKMIEEGRM